MRARPRRELAQLPVINFADVTSCGTNTEVSVPCMFAPVGRRDYDESRIRGSESLLHVAARAGVARALARQPVGLQGRVRRAAAGRAWSRSTRAGLCADGHCLDEGLLHGLDERLAGAAAGRARSCWCCTCWATTGRRTSGAIRRPSSASSRPARTTTCGSAAAGDRQRLRQRAALHRPRAGQPDRQAAGARADASTRR